MCQVNEANKKKNCLCLTWSKSPREKAKDDWRRKDILLAGFYIRLCLICVIKETRREKVIQLDSLVWKSSSFKHFSPHSVIECRVFTPMWKKKFLCAFFIVENEKKMEKKLVKKSAKKFVKSSETFKTFNLKIEISLIFFCLNNSRIYNFDRRVRNSFKPSKKALSCVAKFRQVSLKFAVTKVWSLRIAKNSRSSWKKNPGNFILKIQESFRFKRFSSPPTI